MGVIIGAPLFFYLTTIQFAQNLGQAFSQSRSFLYRMSEFYWKFPPLMWKEEVIVVLKFIRFKAHLVKLHIEI